MWSPKNFAWCGNHKAKLSIMAVMILFIIVSATILLDQHNILTEDLQKAVNEQETCRAQIEQDIFDNRNNPDADQEFVDKNIRHLDVRDEDHPLFGHSPLPKLNVAVDDAEAALEAFSLGSNIFHMGTAMVASGSALVHAHRNNYENRKFSRYHYIGFVLFLLAVVVGVLALSGIENVGANEMRWVAIVVFSCVLGTKLFQCGSVFYNHCSQKIEKNDSEPSDNGTSPDAQNVTGNENDPSNVTEEKEDNGAQTGTCPVEKGTPVNIEEDAETKAKKAYDSLLEKKEQQGIRKANCEIRKKTGEHEKMLRTITKEHEEEMLKLKDQRWKCKKRGRDMKISSLEENLKKEKKAMQETKDPAQIRKVAGRIFKLESSLEAYEKYAKKPSQMAKEQDSKAKESSREKLIQSLLKRQRTFFHDPTKKRDWDQLQYMQYLTNDDFKN